MNLREWALPTYTILMQLSIGALFSLWVIRKSGSSKYGEEKMDRITFAPILIIFSTMIMAMIGSHFHLSKPYRSFLAIRNFHSSWLSREIVFTLIVFVLTGMLLFLIRVPSRFQRLKRILGWSAILVGFATIYSMANIYLLPTQIAWNSPATIVSYFVVMLLLGTSSLFVIMLMDLRFSESRSSKIVAIRIQIIKKAMPWLTAVASIAAVLNILLVVYQIDLLRNTQLASAQASLQLMLELYRPLLVGRFVFTIIGIALLVGIVRYFITRQKPIRKLFGPVYVASLLILIGEILERFLFYATHVRIGI